MHLSLLVFYPYLFFLFVLPIFLIIWIVQAFRKKSTKIIKRICLALIAAFIIFEVLGYATQCKHQWINASCSAPKTCSLCGKTEGEPLDHRWDKATCTKPKTCVVCGQTKGEALGHHWVEATCSAPKTCSRCGATEGVALPHTPGDPEPAADYVNAVYTVTSVCTVCGEIVEQESVPMISLLNDGKFLFNATEFTERLRKCLEKQSSHYSAMLSSPPNETMGIVIDYFDEWVASVLFTDETSFIQSGREDDRDISVMIIQFESDDSSDIAGTILALVQACDPALSYSDAQDVGTSIVLSGQKVKAYEHNGINYLFGKQNGKYRLYISLLKN